MAARKPPPTMASVSVIVWLTSAVAVSEPPLQVFLHLLRYFDHFLAQVRRPRCHRPGQFQRFDIVIRHRRFLDGRVILLASPCGYGEHDLLTT
jgi:hypothetical protein